MFLALEISVRLWDWVLVGHYLFNYIEVYIPSPQDIHYATRFNLLSHQFMRMMENLPKIYSALLSESISFPQNIDDE